MTYEPTLTATVLPTGQPGVTVTFASFAPGTTAINVIRQSGGRSMFVRGGVQLTVAGAAGLLDPEAPAKPCSYLAEMLDAAGNTIAFTGLTAYTPTFAQSWVHNPFDPAHGVAVRIAAATGSSVSGQIPVATYYPIGRQAGVAVTGPRRGVGAAQVAIYADTIAQSDALDAMFGQVSGELGLPPFLCVRFSTALAARIRLPQPLFLAVPAPTQTPINLIGGGTRIGWDLSGAEVDPPAAALAQPLLRRKDVNARYATRAAFNAAYATRLAANTDYNLAGYAG